MTPFKIQPSPSPRAPRFPVVADFSAEELAQLPYRSRASRPLAATLATITAGGVGAQGLAFGSGQGTRFELMGDIVGPVGPTTVETIAPDAAEALIRRLFAEAGYDLVERNTALAPGLRAEGWDPERGVGFNLMSGDDFSSERAWAQCLERHLGEWRHIEDDPRDRVADWQQKLTPEEETEVEQASQRAETQRVRLADGSHVLCFDANDLLVREQWPTQDPPTIEERALALQTLEQQVRVFIEYLQSQGI
ncbi:hypothetical protein JXA47_04400 [Candidatus Sumerlaeota bacterium]|nr:hypothetical protein [Candidatus Sumerlaeota bacterium]